MEGRTIARPDRRRRGPVRWSPDRFNGGPDNCPARLQVHRRCRFAGSCFNGGPDNCPARPGSIQLSPRRLYLLQWRAGQLPGQTVASRWPSSCGAAIGLQWRAGQLPGQTAYVARLLVPLVTASMEGRTIARPDRRRRTTSCADGYRFNGGPDNCPARRPHAASLDPRHRRRFNGGPDNCPARLAAEIVEDQGENASMEGRTIARPDYSLLRWSWGSWLLQWRAGQLPGQTSLREDTVVVIRIKELQWRAGQLPGQTSRSRAGQARPRRSTVASMEGRTIARPDRDRSEHRRRRH